MNYTVEAGAFDPSWVFFVGLLSSTGISLLTYGIYVNLFILSIHTLTRRLGHPGTKFLIVTSCVMAVIGTAQMALSIAETVITARFVQQLVHAHELERPVLNNLVKPIVTAEIVISAINNFVTDTFFLYRCYVIWNFQRKILFFPALLILTAFVVEIWISTKQGLIDPQVGYSLGVATNLVLTTLTGNTDSAGRILWIRRAASHLGLNNLRTRYNRAIEIILESGAIYCITVIYLAITSSIHNQEVYSIGLGFGENLLAKHNPNIHIGLHWAETHG
ncbi:hypothetical protein MVEN_02353600 [Mycena venus]|uniref:Uncharacterized protein n=1 Tax=Mycena venus TaxID=2733690 RepID=A0A8H6X3J4_9AGAR|nr:hypothetical protein MVEN_02353600 [Mycena venus]